jgi:aquaporin Z
MNPARSLGPALVSGTFINLWLYWSATFFGTCIVALLVRNKFAPRLRHGVKDNKA